MNHFITRIVGLVLALPLVAYEVGHAAWSRFNRLIGRRP